MGFSCATPCIPVILFAERRAVYMSFFSSRIVRCFKSMAVTFKSTPASEQSFWTNPDFFFFLSNAS